VYSKGGLLLLAGVRSTLRVRHNMFGTSSTRSTVVPFRSLSTASTCTTGTVERSRPKRQEPTALQCFIIQKLNKTHSLQLLNMIVIHCIIVCVIKKISSHQSLAFGCFFQESSHDYYSEQYHQLIPQYSSLYYR
jgi:hypothetical protein